MTVPPEGLPPPDRPAEEIRAAAEEILARPEFTQEESLYDRILGWIGDRLNDVLGALAGGGRGAFIAWALLIVAVAALGYLVWHIIRSGAVPGTGRARAEAQVTVDEQRRSSSHWRSEADAHAAAGRWRDALRCRWRALVAELSERGRLQDVPGLTAGEYRHLVATSAPPVSGAFGDATDLFERAWYGGGDVGPADHERMVAVAARASEAGSASSPASDFPDERSS